MKKLSLAIVLLTLTASIHAQDTLVFHDFNLQRNAMSKNGMIVLGGWAAGNIIAGGIGALTTEKNSQANYFHQMNVYWNLINMIIAVPSYIGANKKMKRRYDIPQTFKEQNTIQAVYLINFGLDIAYIGLGAWMQEFGKGLNNKFTPLLQGFGNSFMLQGGFLMTLDLVSYILHSRHWNKNKGRIWEQLQFNGNSLKLTIPIK